MYCMYCVYCVYSEISNSGHFETWAISLQRTQLEVPKYLLLILPIHFGPPKKDNCHTKDKIRTIPKCHLFRDSTVCNYNIHIYMWQVLPSYTMYVTCVGSSECSLYLVTTIDKQPGITYIHCTLSWFLYKAILGVSYHPQG